ncbi:P-loop NTPase fold protein [uncultured Marinococcus sp.]|uniref:P-loop NTPase fold protein n=1 Tax=uncultured Marinococcus sp. TaxID=487012 RepID=UPI0026321A2A|nr:P-loop NTPase fold protein [uncultured Marinococcus sp.]
MQDPIKETVIDYIKLKKPGYAVLIKGQWGSGKTHYWKNNLRKELEDHYIPKNIQYLSLYGIKDEDELKASIYYKFLNKDSIKGKEMFNEGFQSIAVGALRYFRMTDKDISWEPKNFININQTILCIDDLERTSIPIKNVLGLIDQLLEENDLKIIILSNEEEIEANNNYYYKKYKEKVIGKTIKLNQSSWDVVHHFIDFYNKGYGNAISKVLYKDFLDLEDEINRYLIHTDSFNFRVLYQAFNDSYSLYKAIGIKKLKELDKKRRKNIVVNTIQFTFAQKIGELDIGSIPKTQSISFLSTSIEELIKQKRETGIERTGENYLKNFPEGTNGIGYINNNLHIMVFYLVGHGELNNIVIKEEIDRLLLEQKEETSIQRKIDYPEDIKSDKEMIETVDQILDKLDQGELPLKDYRNAFHLVQGLNDLGIYPKISAQEVYNKFEISLEKIPPERIIRGSGLIIRPNSNDESLQKLYRVMFETIEAKKEQFYANKKEEWLAEAQKDSKVIMDWLENMGHLDYKFEIEPEELVDIVFYYTNQKNIGSIHSRITSLIEIYVREEDEIKVEWWKSFYQTLRRKVEEVSKDRDYPKILMLHYFISHMEQIFFEKNEKN